MAGDAQFAATRWSLVVAAGRADTPEARRALAELCEVYWYPLYAFARRKGHSAHDAADLTQSFFTRLIEKGDLQMADAERGRFRSFLLAAFKNSIAVERDKARARKRGGGRVVLSIDADAADARYGAEPADDRTPERTFLRSWAVTVLEVAMERLASQYAVSGKEVLFQALRPHVTASADSSLAEQAVALDMSEGAVKVAVHRLRKRFREHLRAEIAQTVGDPEAVDDEIHHLFAALAR